MMLLSKRTAKWALVLFMGAATILYTEHLGLGFYSIDSPIEITARNVNNGTGIMSFKDSFDRVLTTHCDPWVSGSGCLKKLDEFDVMVQGKLNTTRQQDCESDVFLFHTFWQAEDDKKTFIKRAIFLQIYSFLVTQNPYCTKLIFWKLPSFYQVLESEIKQEFGQYIHSGRLELRMFKLDELCAFNTGGKYSTFANHSICHKTTTSIDIHGNQLVGLSDFVRFFVLDIFGGIYTDGDVVLLKDMRLLWSENFAYRWGPNLNFNTAVLGFDKYKNPISKQIFKDNVHGKEDLKELIRAFHPYNIGVLTYFARFRQKVLYYHGAREVFSYRPLKMLHIAMFDPAWSSVYLNSPEKVPFYRLHEFFDKPVDASFSRVNFFRGAFAYHFHLGKAAGGIPKNSYFQRLEDDFKKELLAGNGY
uniref:Alpha-1,4-N-acetylglucosaminyltransferase n=1 Tax=Mucochytrium quahogii TaxID=96639 RepID=A0A7S2W401_9STRA|mmetsp:Transcript_12915/g.27669  ORF Transcript_12915/g.27669 Transcript_12915/m.27669 type:complete len:417 (+) Transcript_12915:46-1296(+)